MQGFNIRKNASGSVVFHNNTPLVLCKGLFVRLVNHSLKLEGVSNTTMKELVRIAYETKDCAKESKAVFDRIQKLGETHCFVVHNGYSFESIAMFERELGKI